MCVWNGQRIGTANGFRNLGTIYRARDLVENPQLRSLGKHAKIVVEGSQLHFGYHFIRVDYLQGSLYGAMLLPRCTLARVRYMRACL